ncbi:MAG: YigZ family protein [Saprospiraceae bacterium]|nr:YigZ family protein [Saprospiraceae bacterium]
MTHETDRYRTLAGPSTGEFRDRGSKFLAYAFPAYSEEEWQERLEEVRKDHPKARHHCYAWRLGLDGNQFRANDDGEPSGTAGRPILGQIDSFGLTNVVVVVVRYFGGTLLGTSGLIQAYRESTAAALAAGEIVERTVEEVFRLNFTYALMSPVMNAVKALELEMVNQDFGEQAALEIAVRQGDRDRLLHELRARIAGKRVEELAPEDAVDGLEIEHLYTR